tara:strand:- start:3774 stop:3971 length:198 start_codon:yes stop_codon:yes gene_type:complete
MVILLIFFFFVGGGWLIGKIVGGILFSKKTKKAFTSAKNDKIIINNYITENHLHITKEDLKALKK